MSTKKNCLKKSIALATTLFAVNLTLSTAHAADNVTNNNPFTNNNSEEKQAPGETKTEFYLRLIATYTRSAMTSLNAWVLPDETETSNVLRTRFEKLNTTTLANGTVQNAALQPLTAWALTDHSNATFTPFYVNDFTYQSILTPTKPADTSDARLQTDKSLDLPLNYIKNASGINVYHIPPNKNWSGSEKYKETYKNFYTTISSIQSYDTWILSGLYASAKSGNSLTVQQNQLMTLAGNSDWFAQVAGANIGTVLRQLLMFNSQMFLLMTQMMEIQKQTLAAQAMTNTLLVLGNRFTESQLYSQATQGGMM